MRQLGRVVPLLLAIVAAPAKADLDDVVTTDTGAPLKVVVRRDTAVYEVPLKSGANRPVSMFEFFYVLRPEDGSKRRTKDGFYRVGACTSRHYPIGWIHQDDVVEWPHRQALGLRPRDKRDCALFYRTESELLAAFSPSGSAPTPLSREPDGGTLDINLVPILSRFPMKVDGDEVSGYRVAYLHSRSGRRSGASNRGPRIDWSKATLDVVFVVDTTSSMQPHINAAKQAVSRIAREIATRAKGVPVRFGLVGYRDTGDEYTAKIFSTLDQGANHDSFQETLADVGVDGGGDTPEDVFAGLKLAIQSSRWNPNAFKHLILMGDAPIHTELDGPSNREKLTIEGVVALAQPRGRENVREKITIHAICCHEGATNETLVEQFKSLAQGDEYPGYFGDFDTKESPRFIEDLILKAVAGLDTVASGGDITALQRDTPGLGLLMEMVQASEEIRGDVPSFASGYCCEIDRKGSLVFEPYLLVQHGDLSNFTALLGFSVKAIRNAGEPGSRDVKRVVQGIQIMATQLNLHEPIQADITIARLAELILGFPVRSKIFDMTFAKLAAMTEADFESWVREIETSQTIVQSHLDNPRIWRSLGRDVPLEQRYCFLKVKDLP